MLGHIAENRIAEGRGVRLDYLCRRRQAIPNKYHLRRLIIGGSPGSSALDELLATPAQALGNLDPPGGCSLQEGRVPLLRELCPSGQGHAHRDPRSHVQGPSARRGAVGGLLSKADSLDLNMI